MCVWYPEWSLAVPGLPSDRPVLVVDERVVAADGLARALGVERGMRRREAESLCPTALVLVRDPGEEARRFEPVVEALESVVPRVEVAEPGLAYVIVEGAVRYFGGEEHLVERIEKELSVVAPGALLGLADGPFAARWAAERAGEGPLIVTDTASFLASLDLATLDHEELVATFRWLGLSTLGELARLPREAIASRFGSAGLEVHRLASGEDRLPQPRQIPPELAVEAHFEDPLELLDQVAFIARTLADRLMGGLRREGIAPHLVEIQAEAASGMVRTRVWRSADPFTERAMTDRVWWQLRAWVESGGVPGGIVRLRLDPSDLSGEGRQLALLENVAAQVQAERAFARAQALVGPDAVLVARPQGGRLPGEQLSWGRWGEEAPQSARDLEAPWPGATPSPSPSLIPDPPPLLEVEWDEGCPVRVRLRSRWEPILNWSGPWRLTGRWWTGEGAVDRYQIVTSAGAFLCLVGGGRTWLAGIYD